MYRGQDILRTGRTGKRDGGYSSKSIRYANEWKGPEHGHGVVLGMVRYLAATWSGMRKRCASWLRVRELLGVLGVESCML